ncbi:hypothetical protein [Streptomyces sp. NPDC003032]
MLLYVDVSESRLPDGHRYYGPRTEDTRPDASEQDRLRFLHAMGREG